MGLKQQARLSAKRILESSSGFGTSITFMASDYEQATINGLHVRHWLKLDTDGAAVNTLNARVTVSEDSLLDAGYPVRNDEDEIDLNDHLVNAEDDGGVMRYYKVKQVFPDHTTGMIVVELAEYQG